MLTTLDTVFKDYAEGRYQAAIDGFARIKKIAPSDLVRVHTTVAQCHFRLEQPDSAAHHFFKAAKAAPVQKLQLSLYELAFEMHRKAGNIDGAFQAAEHVLAIDPRHQKAAMFRRHHLFDFLMIDRLKASNAEVRAGIEAGDAFFLSCELPFNLIHWCSDEDINAKVLSEKQHRFSQEVRVARRQRLPVPGDKIHIGYLSNDFSSLHATMILLRSVIACHDRDAFDVTLYCYTDEGMRLGDDGWRNSIDRMINIDHLNDDEAAALIRKDAIDILVDLKGHTKDARIALVNSGLAPVQVAWLGFPGSGTGIDCDYIIGDAIVTPEASAPYYHEKFCRLPDTYQPNDNVHRPLPPPARRQDLSLPPDKLIFASFNSTKKISPDTFATWVRILRAVPDSVLWMLCIGDTARGNFLRLMKQNGVSEKRIIFAGYARQEDHLARIQAADIVLDTFPCCGHTTTSDCLWAGVPVVSLKGRNFSSRVSESLLRALNMPELVADDEDAYVALAIDLANDAERLGNTRRTLAENRFQAPLFDTERFTRHLEKAYEMMIRRAREGLEPAHLDIPALPARTVPFR